MFTRVKQCFGFKKQSRQGTIDRDWPVPDQDQKADPGEMDQPDTNPMDSYTSSKDISIITENGTYDKLYRNKRFLGKGTYGIVMRADHYLDQSRHAIKIIGLEEMELPTFLREVQILRHLPSHPNIVTYSGCWIEELAKVETRSLRERVAGVFYNNSMPQLILCLKLEYCSTSLDVLLNRRNEEFFKEAGNQSGPRVLPKKEDSKNLHVCADVVTGLAFLHEHNIIHRDIKPENVLYAKETKMFKITDFGLARLLQDSMRSMTEGAGTRAYMAPEQMISHDYDKRVDIFALGLVFFQVMYPLRDQQELVNMLASIRDSDTLPAELVRSQAEVARLITQMVSKSPDARPDLTTIQAVIGEENNKL